MNENEWNMMVGEASLLFSVAAHLQLRGSKRLCRAVSAGGTAAFRAGTALREVTQQIQ